MMKNDNYDRVRMLSFADLGDERGSLIVVEGAQQVPFEIKRVFYMYGSRTEFVLINVAGRSKVRVDDGCGREEVYSLDKPNTGIYIPRMVWKDMYDFSPDSVLLVLASEHYDGGEYLRDYEGFKAALAAGDQE